MQIPDQSTNGELCRGNCMGHFWGHQNKEMNKASRPYQLRCFLEQWSLPSVLPWRFRKVREEQQTHVDSSTNWDQTVWGSLLTYFLACTLLAMPPQIIQFPEDQKVRAGESVELFGKVAGTQPITCTWMKFRKQVSHGGEPPTQPRGRKGGEML